jgi:hypothetical protein
MGLALLFWGGSLYRTDLNGVVQLTYGPQASVLGALLYGHGPIHCL